MEMGEKLYELVVHQGDSAYILSSQFCLEHGLSKNLEE